MKKSIRKRLVILLLPILPMVSINAGEKKTSNDGIQPMVVQQLMEKAKQNNNWKTAVVTGKHEQIVFMNISTATNPNNEIGNEVHAFDQVILIVDGNAKVILNGKTTSIKSGDMIFIPEGTSHNVINFSQEKELKLISFYSATDIPKGATYKTKADAEW